MTKINLIQGSPEWLAFRKTHIGASDIPSIMGTSPFKTKAALWLEKFKDAPVYVNDAMREGARKEAQGRVLLYKLTGELFIPEVHEHPTIPYASASLDGVSESGNLICEIKHPGKLSKKIPLHYYQQIQWQLFCIGEPFAKCLYLERLDDDNYYLEEVSRDDACICELLKEANDFWVPLPGEVCPYSASRDFQWMGEESEEAQAQWIEKKKALDRATLEEKDAKARVLDYTDGLSSLGKYVRVLVSERKGLVDWEKLCAALNIDANTVEKYRKTPVNSIRITENKEDKS